MAIGKNDVWLDGFVQGMVWASANPDMADNISARVSPDDAATEWAQANRKAVEEIRNGGEAALQVAQEPKQKSAKAGK